MRAAVVAGLDIGSTKTAVVIAELGAGTPRHPDVQVLGVGQSRTSGVRREVVTDIEATTESVRSAVKEAELMAGVSVDRLYTGVGGNHIQGWTSTGVVAVSGSEVTAADLDRVHEVARAVVVPTDRELLHAIPQEYTVDAQRGIRDAIGMAGRRLEAEVFIATGSSSIAQNIRKAVGRAGYEVAELVLEPLASSLALLTDDEKEIGVLLVELGAGSTDLLVFHERKVRFLASVPWGGGAVTSDVAKGLSLPYAEAHTIKERFGAARASMVHPNETFEAPRAVGGQSRYIARELLAHIIEQRTDEVLGLVADQLTQSGFAERLGAGAVFSGGGAQLAGMAELGERSLGMPVRIGIPGEGFGGLADSIRRSKFATAAGLVQYGARRVSPVSSTQPARHRGRGAVRGAVNWVRDFLTDFF